MSCILNGKYNSFEFLIELLDILEICNRDLAYGAARGMPFSTSGRGIWRDAALYMARVRHAETDTTHAIF